MRPTRSFAWLILFATGCDAGRGAPRLVPAPPLPVSGVVLDLCAPLSSLAAGGPPLPDRSHFLDTVDGRLVLAPGFAALVRDPADPTTRIAAERLLGDAVVVDVRARVRDDLGAEIGVSELDAFEDRHGAIRASDIVVLLTGYDRFVDFARDTSHAYSSPSVSPGLSLEAMRRLVVERGVRRIATDAPSLASASDSKRRAERLLLTSGGFGAIGLSGLERLPVRGATLVLAPIDLAGASRLPLRALAIVPRERLPALPR